MFAFLFCCSSSRRRRLLNRSLFSHRPRVVFRSFRSRKNKNHHLQILDCSSPTVDSTSRRGGSCLCLYLCLYLLLLCRRLHPMMMRWDVFRFTRASHLVVVVVFTLLSNILCYYTSECLHVNEQRCLHTIEFSEKKIVLFYSPSCVCVWISPNSFFQEFLQKTLQKTGE